MPKSFLNMPGYPIGLRNNNPGNLRPGDNWQGMIGENGGFIQFENIGYGIRALAIDLRTKINNGFDTIDLIIYRYAPPGENDTDAYIGNVIGSVVKYTGIPSDRKLYPNTDTLYRLIRAIVNVELGTTFSGYITTSDINEGISMMGTKLPVGEIGLGFSTLLFGFSLYLLATMPKIPKSRK